MATTAAVQGAGLLTNVWKKLEKAIFAAGGTEEHLARLDKAETDAAFANFAAEIVRTVKVGYSSFEDMIKAGQYSRVCGLWPDNRDGVGQVFHPVIIKTKLIHPNKPLTTQQVWDRYGSDLADLSEFLDYGITSDSSMSDFVVATIWKREDGLLIAAYIQTSTDGHRSLSVYPCIPSSEWGSESRFLIRT